MRCLPCAKRRSSGALTVSTSPDFQPRAGRPSRPLCREASEHRSAETLRLFCIGLPALGLETWLGLQLYGKLDQATFRVIRPGRFQNCAAAVAVKHSRMSEQGSSLNRRALLAGLGAASLFPARVLAAPPYRLKLGELEITVLSDGHLTVPTRFLAVNASETEITSAIGVGTAAITPPCNVTLVRTPTESILIDVGAGPHYVPGTGNLAENMEAAGIDRNSISKVVFTHAHPDHLWGLLDDFDDTPMFPTASYFISSAELNFGWRKM